MLNFIMLYNYLTIYNNKHKLLIDKDEKHKYQDIKRNAAQEKEYQSFLSKKIYK